MQFLKGQQPREVDGAIVRRAMPRALYIMDASIDMKNEVVCQSLWITSARKPESSAFNTEHFKYADNCGGRFFLPPWTLEEMLDDEVARLHGLSKKVVEERFTILEALQG